MSPGPEKKWSKSAKLVFVGIGLLSLVFAVGLGILIFSMLRPRGEKLGATSLTNPQAVLLVNGRPGDSLIFRIDASIGLPLITLLSDDELERQATQQLRSSLLTVRATAPSGTERASSCPVYNGRAMTSFSTSTTHSRSGMLNACSIVLDQPGAWKVRGSVAWSSDLKLKSATLETRLDAAAQ